MRASISTIGPPYGTKAPPPRSIPAEGLIHASRQRFTASFLALGSTVLIRSGLLTKEDFSHTHIFKEYSENGPVPNCVRSWAHQAGDCLRSNWRWRFALGQCLQLVLEYIYYHRFSLKRKCEWIFLLLRRLLKHHTAPVIYFSKLCESSVFLRRSGGAQRLELDPLLFAKVL